MANDQPTDQDLILDHPYRPTRWQDNYGLNICGHQPNPTDLLCGYTEAEHATTLRVEATEGREGAAS